MTPGRSPAVGRTPSSRPGRAAGRPKRSSTWRWPVIAVAAGVMLVGCGGGGDSAAKSVDPATGKKADRVVEVRMLPERRYEPDNVAVKVGETITFKLKNDGDSFHDVTLGDEDVQAAREKEMAPMGPEPMGMDDEANSVTVAKGETKELTRTFDEAGTLIYGCHQPGHYADGMMGTVTVS